MATAKTGTGTFKPFKISIPDSRIQALHQKVEATTFPDEPDHGDADPWSMGVPLADIKRIVSYWKNSFDWRKAEKELNESLPQFVTTVPVAGFGELDIHFVYQTSQSKGRKKAIPLLFLHGWPGCFIEVKKLLPLLTRESDDESQPTFDVVAPSLPNFGFSEGVKKKGFGLAQYSEAMHAVMLALGYSEYVIQGGDWGAFIARLMAKMYPDQVKAVHLNFLPVTPPYPWRSPVGFVKTLLTVPFSSKDRAKLAVTQKYLNEGSGYLQQQDSHPHTLGYSLQDSPTGLLAWIYDKLHSWADSYPWTDDEILTWISIYAFSRAGPAASTRIYHESTHPVSSLPGAISRDEVISSYIPPKVKIGVANLPKELIQLPSTWIRAAGNIVRESEYDKGGHFAAWEVPELLASDIKAFLGKTGEAYGAVSGKDGY